MNLLRLFRAIFSLSLRREMAFRANLFFQVGISITGIGASLAALGIIYTQTKTLGGWSLGETVTLLGTFQIMSGLLSTFIEPNMAWFTNQVKSGKLDAILVQPVPSIFLASLGTCAPFALFESVVGLVVVALGLYQERILPTLWGGIGWLVMLAVGVAITWASRVLLASLVFWAPSVELDVLYGTLWQFGRYPVSIYRQPLRLLLTYVLPVAFIATFPTETLVQGATPPFLLVGGACGTGAIVIACMVWAAGLRRYTSATS